MPVRVSTGHDRRTGTDPIQRREDGPGIPIGAGVHTGLAFVGSVGTGAHVDFTALGDAVNVAARLASAAGTGEILVTLDAADAGRLEQGGLERREIVLKGRSAATSGLVLANTAS